MAIAAVAIDALLSRALRDHWSSALRLGFAILAVAFLAPDVAESARTRMTNGDLIAKYLNQSQPRTTLSWYIPGSPGSLSIVITRVRPRGRLLPPLGDFQIQRHDLFKEQMERNQPLRPVIKKIEATLRSGHSVWVVGYLPFSLPPRPAPHLEPGKQTQTGWRGGPFMTAFGMEAAYFVQSHSSTVEAIKIKVDDPVNSYENQRLARIRRLARPVIERRRRFPRLSLSGSGPLQRPVARASSNRQSERSRAGSTTGPNVC